MEQIGYFEVALRLFLAFLLGGVVGFERETHNRPAGFRTHILVCVGSALIMLVSAYGFSGGGALYARVVDPSRIAAQVVTGVGFLGAGTIFRHGSTVTGLTTAATLWLVSGVGLAVGIGYYAGASIATVMAIISLALLRGLDRHFDKKKRLHRLWVKGLYQPGLIGRIGAITGELGIFMVKIDLGDVSYMEEYKRDIVTIEFLLRIPSKADTTDLLRSIAALHGVIEAGWWDR